MSYILYKTFAAIPHLQALGLYPSSGYAKRGPFGAYQPDPLSVFMKKRLAG